MTAQGSISHTSISQTLNQSKLAFWRSSQQWKVWGGAGLAIATGYWITHLPGPVECLGWAGIVGAGLWSVRRWSRSTTGVADDWTRSLTPEKLQQAIAQTQLKLEQLIQEAPHRPCPDFAAQLSQIEQSLSRQTLDVQIMGTRAVGKTTLKDLLVLQNSEASWQQERGIRAWAIASIEEWAAESILPSPETQKTYPWPEPLCQADVVLFVVQGDLTQMEWMALQQLHTQHKRVFMLLNKQDQYLPTQAELVLEQLKQRVQGVVDAADVMAIATRPQSIQVRRHQVDGTYEETRETPQPQLQPLLDRLETVATQEANQLVLQRAYQEALAVQKCIQGELNQIRRDRTLPILEWYQWIAAGAAFATPLPSLDMVATAAITGKMIQELAGIYNIQLSLSAATDMAGVMAKTLIQMGLVEASSQVLSAVLKGNFATYIAGGALQGVGAAYFTRMAGLGLIELFEVHCATASTMPWRLDNLVLDSILKRIFQEHRRLDVVKDLAQQTLQRLKPEGNPVSVTV